VDVEELAALGEQLGGAPAVNAPPLRMFSSLLGAVQEAVLVALFAVLGERGRQGEREGERERGRELRAES
jgi:hypothetical protein